MIQTVKYPKTNRGLIGETMGAKIISRMAQRYIMKSWMLFLTAFLFVFVNVASVWASDRIVDLRFGKRGEKTRFVIETTRKPDYSIFTLSNPYRVVVDLPEMQWQAKPQKTLGLVKNFRHGLYRPGVTRIVIDAKSPMVIDKHFILTSETGRNYRLVVDLKPVSHQTFKASTRKVETKDWGGLTKKPKSTIVVPSNPTVGLPQQAPIHRKPLIILDAGHGGPDPGAIGHSGVREKHITLGVALATKKIFEASGRYRVKLTRNRDFYIPLRKRYKIAEDENASLFISLHADKIKRKSVRGASIYTLSEKSSDKEAEQLAAQENKSDIIVGVDLSGYDEVVARTLLDFEQRATMEMSWHFAEMLVKEMGKDIRLLRNTHRFAGFAVLKSPTVPSVLIELGYLSNKQDEKLLRQASHHKKIGRALLRALDSYFDRQKRLSKS